MKETELARALSRTEDPDEYVRIEIELEKIRQKNHDAKNPLPPKEPDHVDAGMLDGFVDTKAEFHPRTEDSLCPDCGLEMCMRQTESTYVCTRCGLTIYHFDYSVRNLSYEQEMSVDTSSGASYKRVTHFNEYLALFQGKEASRVSDALLDDIRNELRKERVDPADATKEGIRRILRKLKQSKFYDHVPQILQRLTNKAPTIIPEHIEQQLRDMFVAIQDAFVRHKTNERKNFLSYSYVLYKFSELLGEFELMEHFSLLKSSEKLYAQDQIWKGICEDLNWTFKKSV